MSNTKVRLSFRWFLLALLLIFALLGICFQRAIQIRYHQTLLTWSSQEFWRGVSGKPPTLFGQFVAPKDAKKMIGHHREKLVDQVGYLHRLYLFPRIKPSTEASQWLSREFRKIQSQLGTQFSESGGTRDKQTGESIRSIEIWVDPSTDMTLWDEWKRSVDETELELMQVEKE